MNPLPVVRSAQGIPEVDVQWVNAHRHEVTLVDVREADELSGPLGHIAQAKHVPLGQIAQQSRGWNTAAPIVIICRSGARSGSAALALERAGFSSVASVAGGMMAWNHHQLPH